MNNFSLKYRKYVVLIIDALSCSIKGKIYNTA